MKLFMNSILSRYGFWRVGMFLLMVFCQYPVTTHAQIYLIKKADAEFSLFNYSNAKSIYVEAYNKSKGNKIEVARQVAICAQRMNDYKEAQKWCSLVLSAGGYKKEDVTNYAIALMSNGNYVEAKKLILSNRNLLKGDKSLASIWARLSLSCDSSVSWIKEPVSASLSNAKFNSSKSDWGAIQYDQNFLMFASDRNSEYFDSVNGRHPLISFRHNDIDKNEYNWTENSYLKLYTAAINDSTTLLFNKKINSTGYHVGNASFTSDKKQVYFTCTRVVKKRSSALKAPSVYVMHDEIYYSVWSDKINDWETPQPFKYNDIDNYSVGDVYISPNGLKLYFVSDIPGMGYGGTDIYYCTRKSAADDWSAMVNLGEGINTLGNERTPYIIDDYHFYFASDGRIGMGGLDIYLAKHNGSGWSVSNLKYPINSSRDDFSPYFLNEYTAYFSSDRVGGKGDDDIYYLEIGKPKPAKSFLEFVVYDTDGKSPLGLTQISIEEDNNALTKHLITSPSGISSVELKDTTAKIKVAISKEGYIAYSTSIIPNKLDKRIVDNDNVYRLEIKLDKVVIGKAIRLDNIYYDRNKADIRPDAALELQKLLKLLNDNPTFVIEISSHTSSRGSAVYNMDLSQRRATSVVNFLIQNGISADRLKAKGYGETRLLNGCSDGIECTEAEHQLNRRTEFAILKM